MSITREIELAIAQGDRARAQALLEEALKTSESADLFVQAADLATNDAQRRQLLAKAISIDPAHANATARLAQLNQAGAALKLAPAVATASKPAKKSTWPWVLGIGAILGALGLVLLASRPSTPSTSSFSGFSPTRVVSTPTPAIIERTLTVARRTNTGILVQAGDVVIIQARGQIKVGPFIGTVGPDGTDDSQQFWASGYSIVENFRHGALMYSLDSLDSWYFCGATCDFTLLPEATSGYLELEVNDNEQGNNSGSFTVDVTVRRGG